VSEPIQAGGGRPQSQGPEFRVKLEAEVKPDQQQTRWKQIMAGLGGRESAGCREGR